MKYMNYRYMYPEEGEGAGGGQGGAPAGQTPPASGQEGQPPAQPEASWPETWRATMAGGDEKALKRLERFASPTEVFRSFRSFEQRQSSGEIKAVSPFPDKGTDEQKNAWRTENGIPESADKYQLKLQEGLVIGDQDKPIIDSFLKAAHEKNLPSDAASAAVQWYFDHVESQAEQMSQSDKEYQQKAEDELRSEWGNEYRPNLNGISALLDMGPPGIKEKFFQGRLADGSPIGSDPDMLRFLANLSRDINPPTTLVPGAGANIASAIDDEIAKIEGEMRTNRKAYNQDEKMQERYRQLLDAREKQKGRAA